MGPREPRAKRKTRPAPSFPPPDAIAILRRGTPGILGRSLDDREAEQFGKYLEILSEWQKIHRLVGSAKPNWIAENLFLDSLLFLKALPHPIHDLLDLGAGAGFPGVPLKIVVPEWRLTLVEAKRRRASFLSTLVRELQLSNVQVINARAEELVGNVGFRFDAVVTRCAGSLEAIFPLSVRFLRPGGTAVASGPPRPAPLPFGKWIEVLGPNGTRRFAIHHNAQASV